MFPAQTDVVIVGAGPTGLTLGATLAARGVDSVVLDEQDGLAPPTSRAALVHSRTLEVLEGIGVSEELVAEGWLAERFVVRDGHRTLGALDFRKLPTAYPHLLLVPQSTSERILQQRLEKSGGVVHRSQQVTAVKPDGDGVVVTTRGSDGVDRQVRGRYVVGADGGHSVVRQSVGISFDGGTYPEIFVLADIRMESDLSREDVNLFLSPAGPVVLPPLPDGMHRIIATMKEAPAEPGVADIQRILDERGPGGMRVTESVWSSRFRVHHRMADRYREGRVFVAGDAAHVHSPAGGQGMNTGIQDAAVLGGVLVDALGGNVAALDEYEARRRPVAVKVVKFTDILTRIATTQGPLGRALRNTVAGALLGFPPVRRRITTNMSGIAFR